MKVVHIYAQNVEVFANAVEGTDCKVNASSRIDDIFSSLYNYNARDVIGLVIFANPFTKKCAKLVRMFDQLFVFSRMPIIIVSDNATEILEGGYLRVENSELIALDSEENTISDTDINRIFATLLIKGTELYDLESCGMQSSVTERADVGGQASLEPSDDLKSLLAEIGITDKTNGRR